VRGVSMLKRLLLALLALLPLAAHAGIALVQNAQNRCASTTTCSITLSGVASNDLIDIYVVSNTTAQTLSSIADSNGTVSTAVAYTDEEPGSGQYAGAGVYYVTAAASGTHTFTVTFGATANIMLYAAEWSGAATSSVLDSASPIGSGVGDSSSSSSISPSANGELVLGFANVGAVSATISSWGSGLTQDDSNNSGPSTAWAYIVQTSASSASASYTNNGGAAWTAIVVAFKAASAQPSVIGQAEASSTTAQTSLATGTSLNSQAGDRFVAIVASESPTPPTVTDTAGDVFNLYGALTPQSGYYLYGFITSDNIANSADTLTAHGTSIYAIAGLQLRGTLSSLASFFPSTPGPIVQVTGGPALSSNAQVAPGSGTNAITSLATSLAVQPVMVIGFTAIPGKNGAAVNAAPNAGTGFTAQTGVWETWGGGAGDYLGVFETEVLTSVTPAAATFTAPTYGSGNYGTFVWILPAASVGY
jgi:hypothetical protein